MPTSTSHLIGPSQQTGRKWITVSARQAGVQFGLEMSTPVGAAEAVLARADPAKSTVARIGLSSTLGLDSILRTQDLRRLHALGWSGARLAESIHAIRLSGTSPEEYKQKIPRKVARVVSEVYAAYEKWLYSNGVVDETELFVQAEMAASRVQPPRHPKILSETPLSEAARSFVEALVVGADSKTIIGHRGLTSPGTAGQVLGDDWDWEEDLVQEPRMDLVRVPAIEDEARFVMDEILRRRLPLDTVEIAYPRHTPYLPLLLGETKRRGLPLTSAAGTPLLDLPAGQAVRLFLEWLKGGQDSRDLVRLLRSGLIHLPDHAKAHHIVGYLLEFHAIGTSKAYKRAFDGLRKNLQDDLERVRGTDREKAAQDRLKRIKSASRAVERIFGYVPAQDDTANAFAGRLRRFVEAMTPAPEEDESTAAKGRAELITRLKQIEEGPDSEHPSSHLVRRFLEWIGGVIVNARLDAPGALHITPLDSAGLAGRPHLFVIGMDSERFLPSPVEDVFLPDEFCASYDRLAGPLSSEQRVEAAGIALKRAIARTSGTATVVVAEGSVASDSQAEPASAFIELEAIHGPARRERPRPGRGISGRILRARRGGVARELLERHYPALEAGARAAADRKSETFTAADAFVGPRNVTQSILDSPFSASRLQQLATCPFQFFQQQVLSIPTIEQRRPGQWMTPLENGALVHDALNRFNHEVMAGEADPGDTKRALSYLEEAFRAFERANPAPSEFARRAKWREIQRIAQVVTSIDREVVAAELGFGMAAHRAVVGDHEGDFELDLGGTTLRLRGRIDAAERTDRGLVITDYKTGRSDRYDESNLLDDGKRLQWVLYAYAYEALRCEPVDESGYLFVSGDSAGQTAYSAPPPREEIGELLSNQLALARRGDFGPSLDLGKDCKWCDFKRVCGNLGARRAEVQAKLDGMEAEAVTGWAWAERYKAKRRK